MSQFLLGQVTIHFSTNDPKAYLELEHFAGEESLSSSNFEDYFPVALSGKTSVSASATTSPFFSSTGSQIPAGSLVAVSIRQRSASGSADALVSLNGSKLDAICGRSLRGSSAYEFMSYFLVDEGRIF